MKLLKNLSPLPVIAAAVLLAAGCLGCILFATSSVPDSVTPTPTVILNDLSEAENGVSRLLRAGADNGEYFSANFFPTLSGARGDGAHDDTEAIRQALNDAAPTGGTVYLPQGTYRISGPLSIPAGVTLRGDFSAPDAKQSSAARTVITVAATTPQDGAPLIELADAASLVGITVYYEGQTPGQTTAYPATVSCVAGATVKNIALINTYRGICVTGTAEKTVRLEGIWISALDYGVLIAENGGTVFASDITVSPTFWLNYRPDLFTDDAYAATDALIRTQMNAVTLENVRDVTVSRLKTEDSAVGLLVNIPAANKGAILASEISVSMADTPVRILSLPADGMIVSDSTFRPDNEAGADCIQVMKGADAPLIFSNCSFSGLPKTVINARNSSFISFYHCSFGTWWNTCFDVSDDTFLAVSPQFRSAEQKAALGQNGFGLLYDAEAMEESSTLLFSVSAEKAAATGTTTVSGLKDTVRITPATILNAASEGVLPSLSDCTAALQAALDKAAETGSIVFLPEGIYCFSSRITIPDGVRLIGTNYGVADGKTTLLFYSERPSDHAYIELKEQAGLEGICVRVDPRSQQNVQTFAVTSLFGGVRLKNLSVESLRGIRFTGGIGCAVENVRLTVQDVGLDLIRTEASVRHLEITDPSDSPSSVALRVSGGKTALSEITVKNAACGLQIDAGTTEAPLPVAGTLLVLRNVGTGVKDNSGTDTTLTNLAYLQAPANGTALFTAGETKGTLTVQAMLTESNGAESVTVSGEGKAVDLRAVIFAGQAGTSVKSGNKVTVSGATWIASVAQHAATTGSGNVTFTANLVTSAIEFSGIDTNYFTIPEGADVKTGTNISKFIYVPSEESAESGAGEKQPLR